MPRHRLFSWRLAPLSQIALFFLAALPASAQAPVLQVPSGSPTLTAAISAISDGGIIELAAGTYTAPTGGFAILNPNKRFTIRAATGALVVLSGNNTQPVLQYQVSSAPQRGHVIFEDLVFRNGRSSSNGLAGGVTLNGGAQATFRRCTFENSTSQAASTGGGGAAVFNGSKAIFEDCIFQNNTAKNEGAGLRVGEGSEAYIDGGQFLNNSCAQAGHRNSAAGGGMHVTNSKVWISDTRFEGNRAGYTGGGFYILGSWVDPVTTPQAEATLVNCTFEGNTADNDPGVATVGPTEGGAVHSEDQATVKIYNSRFFKNDADLGGGISQYRSINEVYSSAFFGNRSLGANGFGGAIKSNSEDTTIDGAVNRRNVSLTVKDSLFVGRFEGVTTVGEKGGGIFVNGDVNRAWGLSGVSQQGTVAANRATAVIDDCAFIDLDVTQATQGLGGGLEANLTNLTLTNSLFAGCDALGSFGSGGAVRVVIGSAGTLTGNTFVANSAVFFGGALYSQGADLNASGNFFYRNEISPGTSEPSNQSYGAAVFTAPLIDLFGTVDIIQTGSISGNKFSENIGLPIFDDDRDAASTPYNDQRYDNNQFFNTTFGSQIYSDSLVGPKTSAELNSLTIARASAPSTDKSPASNNSTLGTLPNLGMLLAVPPSSLAGGAPGDPAGPVPAYLAYAWSGSGATLDGSSLATNWGYLAGTAAVHTLAVGPVNGTATITNAAIPDATIAFTPISISSGNSATLSWSLDNGTFVYSAIDQQIVTGGAASGSTTVTPNVTRPYTLYVITREGGVVRTESIFVGEVPGLVFEDGFETGNTSQWDQTLP